MNTDDLKCFLLVAKHGAMRKAAVELGISQPAVTLAMQRLEEELGFKLFSRSRSGVELTKPAVFFHKRLVGIDRELKEAIRESNKLHLGELGILRVGLSPIYASKYFSEVAHKFLEQRPGARIITEFGNRNHLINLLRIGVLDICICALPLVRPQFANVCIIGTDVVRPFVNSENPLSTLKNLTLKDLAGVAWILPDSNAELRKDVERKFLEDGLEVPRVAIEASGAFQGLMKILVSNSNFVALGSELEFDGHEITSTVGLDVEALTYPQQVVMLTNSGSMTPLVARLAAMVEEEQR